MIIKDKTQALDIYQNKFGKINTELGYNLIPIKTKNGWLVIKTYQRNCWVDEVTERKVLLNNDGKIYENHIRIGEF